jgi:hypothetical protein
MRRTFVGGSIQQAPSYKIPAGVRMSLGTLPSITVCGSSHPASPAKGFWSFEVLLL